MAAKKAVLIVGFDPTLLDFSEPVYAALQMTVEKVMAGLKGDQTHLNALGYDAQLCLVDLGETATAELTKRLQGQPFDCVMVGAGVRSNPKYFLLFEKLLNAVHEHAPQAKLCFNTKPSDTAEAIQRWC
jgi:hypothetical protein